MAKDERKSSTATVTILVTDDQPAPVSLSSLSEQLATVTVTPGPLTDTTVFESARVPKDVGIGFPSKVQVLIEVSREVNLHFKAQNEEGKGRFSVHSAYGGDVLTRRKHRALIVILREFCRRIL